MAGGQARWERAGTPSSEGVSPNDIGDWYFDTSASDTPGSEPAQYIAISTTGTPSDDWQRVTPKVGNDTISSGSTLTISHDFGMVAVHVSVADSNGEDPTVVERPDDTTVEITNPEPGDITVDWMVSRGA